MSRKKSLEVRRRCFPWRERWRSPRLIFILQITRLSTSSTKRRASRTRRRRLIVPGNSFDDWLHNFRAWTHIIMSEEETVRGKVPGHQSTEQKSVTPWKGGEDHELGADRLHGCCAFCIKAGAHIDDGCAWTVCTMRKHKRKDEWNKFEGGNDCGVMSKTREAETRRVVSSWKLYLPLHRREMLYTNNRRILIMTMGVKQRCGYSAKWCLAIGTSLKRSSLRQCARMTGCLWMNMVIT